MLPTAASSNVALYPSHLALSSTKPGGKAGREGRTVVRTNKSHYPPQRIFSDPPPPARRTNRSRSETQRETFPPRRAKEKRGLSQDIRDLPLLRDAYRILWRSFRRRPFGIFFRRKRRRATRSERRSRNFRVLWMKRKVGQGNVVRHLDSHRSVLHSDESHVRLMLQFLIDSKVFSSVYNSPLPLLPTNLRSLNLATWFFIKAVEFLSSAQQFSSLPARTVTRVPSPTSPRATTLKATGRVLLDLQCAGKTVQTKCGDPVTKLSIWFH